MANIESIIYTLQHRDRNKDKIVPPRTSKSSNIAKGTKTFTIFELILHIVNLIVNSCHIVPDHARPYLFALQKHFSFSTLEEASLLCAICSLCDDNRIRLRDIAQVYSIHTLNIMKHSDALDDLVRRQFIIRRKESEANTFRITEEVIQQIRDGDIPHPKNVSGLDVMGFISETDALLERCRRGEIENDDLEESFCHLIEVNKHLHIAKTLLKYDLDWDNLLLLLVMMSRFVNMHDDNIVRSDLEDYFHNNILRHHAYMLEIGEHTLMDMKLIEHSCCEGQVSPTEWKLTEEAKQDLLKELNIKTSVSRVNLTHYEEICMKKLYYNVNVMKQVKQLQSLLKPRRMKQVLERMEKEGMRKGFSCIFYGRPGTGKTETVLQLARKTKRDIMLVDVPSIRSKWVGDTEKNIKRVFENYRAAVRENPAHAPILVFNEADAILNKRTEGATGSVDKMENAMQNIILEELERLEGIMIATTNLTGSLDSAFERRFLYKIEFEKPTANERQYIWKSLVKGISKKQAHELAERYDFSGGQIENISRKRLINDIILGRDNLDMESIIESCENELINKKQTRRIGFN